MVIKPKKNDPVESTENMTPPVTSPAANIEQPEAEVLIKQSIAKPKSSRLDKFKAKQLSTIAGVSPLPERLPVMKISDAKDFVRLHPDEELYWSDPWCFVNVPIKGGKDTLHLISEDLALKYVSSSKIKRFRLALASKPWDTFFLCMVPVTNLDNTFNKSALEGCEAAKTKGMTTIRSSPLMTRTHFLSRNGHLSHWKI
jgi:hypothetical protein